MIDSANPILALDFDGTVLVGDAPVWAYAEEVIADVLDAKTSSADELDTAIRSRLAAFLDGIASSPSYRDGYGAVAALAAEHATPEQLQRAFAASRRALATGTIPVAAPSGLAEFLDSLDPRIERVLITNSPADGIRETLDAIGLGQTIDRIVTDAAKPAGWSDILRTFTADRPASSIMSVGDIWGNDLQIPLAVGCMTALIDRFGHRAGPAHLTAGNFEGLYDGIREWTADPAAFAASHQPTTTATEPATTANRITSTTHSTQNGTQ